MMRLQHASAVRFAPLALTASALAQSPIYSNGSTDPAVVALGTGALTSSGAQAPAGFEWSEVQRLSAAESNAVAGYSTHPFGPAGAYRFADNFTVPPGRIWRIDGASFFAFQTGAPLPPGSSPFSGLNLRIWDGSPAAPGSQVIFGDAVANRLVASTPTPYFRVFNSVVLPLGGLPDTSRLIWSSTAALGVALPPGTYWLDWQYATVASNSVAFSPPVTKVGLRTEPGWNALQLKASGAWTPVVDSGKPDSASDAPQDLPFTLLGVNTCPTDFNLDGVIDPDDLADAIGAFFATPPDPRADFNGDGTIDPDDLADYIGAFFGGGC